MVDNVVAGIYANISKINPETLSAEGKLFLRQYRESLQERRSVDKSSGNLVARTIIRYHNDKGEDIKPLLLEMVTVAFYALDPYRRLAIDAAQYLLLGAIFAVLTISEDETEIEETIEQLMIGIFTNPIYEFDAAERLRLIRLTSQIEAYIATLNFYSGKFGRYIRLISAALRRGLEEALEICNAGAEELLSVRENKGHFWDRWVGRCKFYLNLGWPMFNLNANLIIRWLNKKTGIELWPVNRGGL
ncbi:MAG: hypothetical protein LBQ83_06835 [Candidatus Margulisbacteria bacterium]|jgi:hypothetical protein|nr:hypothetical protein [Candidatus Margulisiibacteriota bacterium]